MRPVAVAVVLLLAACSGATTDGLVTYPVDREAPTSASLLGAVAPEGIVDVMASCVALRGESSAWTLAFPEGSTRTSSTVHVVDLLGDTTTVRDGDAVALVGGGDGLEPSGPAPAAPAGCPPSVRQVVAVQVVD